MKRVEITEPFSTLLAGTRQMVEEVKAQAVVLLADLPYDFAAIRNELHPVRLVVATDKVELFRTVLDDDVDLVPLVQEPESRRLQLSQALLEAIADELLQSGDKVVALYPGFELHEIDTLSIISLGEHLARLTSRDLQRLETQVPLETLRTVVDLAIEIGREGREGKPVGTLFVVGQHRKVLKLSHEQVHDPFRGYSAKERQIRDARVRESVKEIAQLDGAFIISADGIVQSAGRHIDASAGGITLSKGLGARHWAAAAISKATKAIAIAVSESTGTVRLFQDGKVVLRIEPMHRAMKWQNFEGDESNAAAD
ncbi:MAG TPA: diadenylate cyclase [Planctomycetaceae bacterium]|nr:diadenylate cyclase [Planctomycetaceae bacterium]